MKRIRHLTIIAIATICLVSDASGVPAQPPPGGDCRYFPETGHYVCDAFLAFFERRGDVEMFGYPLTGAFHDPTHSDLWVQYFQRARMEEHPDNPPPYDVQLGLLVDELGHVYPPANPEELPPPGDPAHHYFPETQHVVSYAFLDFFRAHDGLLLFGYPRSEMVYEEDMVVQYFQRVRMEWHRDHPPGQRIVLTNMGERYLERFGVPGGQDRRRAPPPRAETPGTAPRGVYRAFLPLIVRHAALGERPAPAAAPSTAPTVAPTTAAMTAPTAAPMTAPVRPVGGLDVSASVRYPISGRTGTQTAFVYVSDQRGAPVAGARATLVVHYPAGDETCVAKATDAAGSTQCSFDIPSPPVGQRVVIDITVTYDGLIATTQTFFTPWW